MSAPRSWSAFLPMEPPTVTHNALVPYTRPDGSTGIRKDARLLEAEDAIAARIGAAGTPDAPLDGPLRLTVAVCYGTRGAHAQGEPHTVKPDADNLVKTLQDLLETHGVIAHDQRVCELVARKAWADPAGIYVLAEEIGGVDGRG